MICAVCGFPLREGVLILGDDPKASYCPCCAVRALSKLAVQFVQVGVREPAVGEAPGGV